MIFGIGCDLTAVSRFSKYWENQSFIKRFFNDKEIKVFDQIKPFCEYYASRFAAKESFVKALGTGFSSFNLKDIYVKNNEYGKPELHLENQALVILKERCPDCTIHLSLSHEKDYAQAFVVIEK